MNIGDPTQLFVINMGKPKKGEKKKSPSGLIRFSFVQLNGKPQYMVQLQIHK